MNMEGGLRLESDMSAMAEEESNNEEELVLSEALQPYAEEIKATLSKAVAAMKKSTELEKEWELARLDEEKRESCFSAWREAENEALKLKVSLLEGVSRGFMEHKSGYPIEDASQVVNIIGIDRKSYFSSEDYRNDSFQKLDKYREAIRQNPQIINRLKQAGFDLTGYNL